MPYVGAVLLRACKPVLHYNQLSSNGIMMRDAAMVGERKTWEIGVVPGKPSPAAPETADGWGIIALCSRVGSKHGADGSRRWSWNGTTIPRRWYRGGPSRGGGRRKGGRTTKARRCRECGPHIAARFGTTANSSTGGAIPTATACSDGLAVMSMVPRGCRPARLRSYVQVGTER